MSKPRNRLWFLRLSAMWPGQRLEQWVRTLARDEMRKQDKRNVEYIHEAWKREQS